MSLLNPATAYRRSTNRPRIPVVLPLVRVDVDNHGHLAVTVDEAPFPDIGAGEASTLSPADLRPLLDRIAVEHGSALRVEIHEPDGKVFTDFHTPEPPPRDRPPTAAPMQEAPIRRTTSWAQIGSGAVTGTGFAAGEEVAIAVVIYRHQAKADGTIELNLPVALLERHGADVMLVGATSGAVNVTPPKALEPVREAS
ncbi:MAG TPA: hypothetical protein VIR30_17635 [Nocardioides sp.]